MTSTINASTTAGIVTTADTSGVLALQTAGTTAVTVDASANVGIGTASPSYKLDVVRSGNGVSARFSQGSFFTYIYSGSAASYFSADTGALTSYGLTASTLQMSAGNGADQLVVSQTSVKPNVLLDISGASAGQIKFPATQNASSNANTLDDYEEGTWTPIDSSGAGLTFTDNTGTYVKIGSLCYITGYLSFPSTASGANAIIGGLPFAASGPTEYNNYGPPIRNNKSLSMQVFGVDGAKFVLLPIGNYTTYVLNSAMTSGTMQFSLTYRTA